MDKFFNLEKGYLKREVDYQNLIKILEENIKNVTEQHAIQISNMEAEIKKLSSLSQEEA